MENQVHHDVYLIDEIAGDHVEAVLVELKNGSTIYVAARSSFSGVDPWGSADADVTPLGVAQSMAGEPTRWCVSQQPVQFEGRALLARLRGLSPEEFWREADRVVLAQIDGGWANILAGVDLVGLEGTSWCVLRFRRGVTDGLVERSVLA